MLGLCGPAVAGVGLTYLTQDKMGRRDYWQRVIDPRRISIRWYLVIFLFFPAISVLAALLDILSGGSGATRGSCRATGNYYNFDYLISPCLPGRIRLARLRSGPVANRDGMRWSLA
jgi:hypothetical protein